MFHEVPALSANSGGNNALTPTQLTTLQPVYPPLHGTTPPHVLGIIPPPAPNNLPPAWPAVTDLVIGHEGLYQQSDQSPEIQACLGAAVRRANGNLVFVDGFPDPHRKAQWLGESLVTELSMRRKGSTSMEAVDDRAQKDQQYLNLLLYMVTRAISIRARVMTAENFAPDTW